jgi:ribosome recycling factor
MSREILLNADAKMRKAVEALRKDLASLRTGRATPALVDQIRVEYYGVPTPLNQVATITVPEARLIVIQPWDKSVLTKIEKAILKSDLGVNPVNDGNVLRLQIPPLTEERRKQLVKMVRKRVEEGRVALRNLRREAMEELREQEKNKKLSQDEHKRALEQLQRLTDSFISQVEQIGQSKETELMEV